MELKEYQDMYKKMTMSKEMDEKLKNAICNQEEIQSRNRRKWHGKRTVVAAALGCMLVAGGVSAYAATGHFSLKFMFTGESKQVQDAASDLLDTRVEQTQADNREQSEWATFEVREAICDKNKVLVQVAAKAVNPEKYLLVPEGSYPEKDSVFDLGLKGVDEKLSMAEYAKGLGKECLAVGAGIVCEAGSQSITHRMEEDGTLLFIIEFRNEERNDNLDYVCKTAVFSPENGSDGEIVKGAIDFSLTDKTDMQVVKYLPVSTQKVEGTNLVLDEVTFEKSRLEMICNVRYHYADDKQDWEETSDADICFFMLDNKGKIIEEGEGGGTTVDGNSFTQSWTYSLQDLPESITFLVKDVFEEKTFGKVEVKAVK